MESRPPTIGFEDGTIDVERLLVEPQDGHVSVDSVICFNEKNTEKAMDMQEVSRSFGDTNTGIAHEGENILNGDVLDSLHSEVGGGYFRLQNDFCSMGEEYLLGDEFAESITNLDYVSSGYLQTSVSESSVLPSGYGIISPWKADLFRIMEVPDCQNDELNVKSCQFGEIPSPCHESEVLIEEKPVKSPASCTLLDIGKFHDISSCSFQDILSDENTSRPQSAEMLCSPKNENNDESGQTGKNGETRGFQKRDALEALLSRTRQSDALPMQKRSRKPTQRYIDELADPISRHSKRRREVSSSTLKDKSTGVKDRKKCHMVSRAMKLPAEESSVKAIQVPFASIVHKECPKSPSYNMVRTSDRGNQMTKPKDSRVTPENQKKMDECMPAVHLMKRSDSVAAASQKKKDEDVTGAHLKKRDECSTVIHLTKGRDSVTVVDQKKKDENVTGAHLNKRDDHLRALSQKKRNDCEFAASPKKRDDCFTAVRQKKRDDYPTDESPEEVKGRRKHHRLWTLAEVKKLIDGVSEYGVGRWSRIKKIFFSTSAHRTSVDLKDKWRNLLKASGMQGQRNQQGEKKRNLAWRPLPKSILRRVCELATMYPYPKGGKPKIAHIRHVSPDSTDITLSDYRRILRSINGN